MKKYIIYAVNYLLRDIPIHIINVFMSLFPPATTINYIRGAMVAPFLGKCGKRFQLGKNVIINHPESLCVGDDCYISHSCYVQAKGNVTFGDHVIIGPMSIIASSNHKVIDGAVTNIGESKTISIGSGTWCGGHVTITAGTAIGKSVIVGAGAVVTKSIEDNQYAFGVPAKAYKMRKKDATMGAECFENT